MNLRYKSIAILLLYVISFETAYCQTAYDIQFRFHQTPTNRNPNIKWFLQELKATEEKLVEMECALAATKLTKLRKLYYDSPAFDKYLITTSTKVRDMKISAQQIPRPNYSRTISTGLGLRYHIDDIISLPEQENGLKIPIREDPIWSQEIAIDSNSVTDIGHLLCGMDAANHPHPVHFPFPFRFIRVDRNEDAITWIGDLGSVVAEYYYLTKTHNKFIADSKLQELIDEFSPAADNLGNIQASIFKKAPFGKNENGDFYKIFCSFYLGTDNVADSLRKHAFLQFATEIGLKWGTNHFLNKEKMIKSYSKQVGNAAAMYLAVAAKRKGYCNLLIAFPSVLKLRNQPVAAVILEKFFDALQYEIIHSRNNHALSKTKE